MAEKNKDNQAKVHAPYHFVPMSKHVYMPNWAHLVSHDFPFEDGYSGVLEYSLTNHTPLCVGSEKDDKGVLKFARDPLGNLVIPGSSLKGMIRNVLEIASFGKFNSVDDQRLSFREIAKSSDYLKEIIQPRTVKAGWIQFTKKGWIFTPCEYAKVSHKEINKVLEKTIKNDSNSMQRYKQLPLVTEIYADIIEIEERKYLSKQTKFKVSKLSKDKTDNSVYKNGHIVFTHKRIEAQKNGDYEFSYYFYDLKEPCSDDVSELVTHLFANHQSVTEEIDGQKINTVDFLKKHAHPELGIPVFALKNSDNSIHSFGFAQMPRITYQKSMHEMIANQNKAHLSDCYFDMAELIFGSLRENGLGLKSRVSFSDAVSKNATKEVLYLSHPQVLSNPKPSFYPIYVEQNQHLGKFNDYNDKNKDATLAGFKKYIAKRPKNAKLADSNINSDKENILTTLELCPERKEFAGTIVFHNLKIEELAALIWCLELSGSYHQLGHAKPLGAGVVSIQLDKDKQKIKANASAEVPELTKVKQIFVDHMNKYYPASPQIKWENSPQINYLLSFGKLEDNSKLNTEYMKIDNGNTDNKKKNDFQNIKNDQTRSGYHSLYGNRKESNSLTADHGAASFGKGRLHYLLSNSKSIAEKNNDKKHLDWLNNQEKLVKKAVENNLAADKRERERIEHEKKLAEKEKVEREKKEHKESLTEHQNKLDDLKNELPLKRGGDQPGEISKTLDWFIANPNESEKNTALDLYKLARSAPYEFHKRPKARVSENKEKLLTLLDVYGVSI